MSLADEYARQFRWRSWDTILDALPALGGCTVLDLGCAAGDLAEALSARGARVIGVDADEELLRTARGRGVPRAEFRTADLRTFTGAGLEADGIWCSFAGAYFPALAAALRGWTQALRPGGWLALTEIDDLFGHEPLSARTRALLDGYADDALAAGRYDFRMGRRLEREVEAADLTVTRAFSVPDRELAFDGPANDEVVDAWRNRLARMRLLAQFCGAEFDAVREELLACLVRADHRSTAAVRCCLATR
jgi:SAM-dependent methyltransferase